MANLGVIRKGSTVEVSNNDPGFHGAWYVATLLDVTNPSSPTRPTRSSSSSSKKKKPRYLIKYHTLFKDVDLTEPLTEEADAEMVRPVPPSNIRRRNSDGRLQVAEVVEGGDGGLGEFERYEVVDAFHRDGWWIGVVKDVVVVGGDGGKRRKYVVEFRNPTEEFVFERGELRLHVDWIDRRWWVPPKEAPEQELDDARLGFITPSNKALITGVDNGTPLSSKKNTRSRERSESNRAAGTSITYSRKKRSGNLVKDGSHGKRLKSSGSKGNTKVTAFVLGKNAYDVYNDNSSSVEHGIKITQTQKSKDGKSGRQPKFVKRPTGLLEGGHEVLSTDFDDQPLAVWYQSMYPHSVLKKRSCSAPPDNSLNQAVVTIAETTTDDQQDLPFIKRSRLWDIIGLHLTWPQKPHFLPLREMKEDYREGFAIGQMVTYANVVQTLKDLQVNDPVSKIKDSLENLDELETHGFNVGPIRARLNELLGLKSKIGQDEKKLEECNHEKSMVEKEVDELELKMLELEEKMTQAVTMQKTKEEQVRMLQSNLQDSGLAFEKLLATPL